MDKEFYNCSMGLQKKIFSMISMIQEGQDSLYLVRLLTEIFFMSKSCGFCKQNYIIL